MTDTCTIADIARMIDHSLLHPTMTDDIVRAGCELARAYDVATVCVKPYSVRMAHEIVAGTGVVVCAVIGFPHGNSTPAIKVAETQQVIADGATEVDMVVNVGNVLGDNWDTVSAEIEAINAATVAGGALLKVIFETDFLQDEHIIRLCEICSEHKVAFVKTSTGYGFVKQPNGFYSYQGATDHNLALMRQHCAAGVQIKAAGGIRTLDDVLRVRALGVTRIGATATQVILEEAKQRGYR